MAMTLKDLRRMADRAEGAVTVLREALDEAVAEAATQPDLEPECDCFGCRVNRALAAQKEGKPTLGLGIVIAKAPEPEPEQAGIAADEGWDEIGDHGCDCPECQTERTQDGGELFPAPVAPAVDPAWVRLTAMQEARAMGYTHIDSLLPAAKRIEAFLRGESDDDLPPEARVTSAQVAA